MSEGQESEMEVVAIMGREEEHASDPDLRRVHGSDNVKVLRFLVEKI